MGRIAFVNGRYVRQAEASVNVEDRGYQFSDGIYEVLAIQDGRFVDTGLHLDRLDRSLREMRIRAPMGRPALLQVLGEVVRRNRVRRGLIYMQVTRGVSPRDHAFPPPGTPPALVVTVRRTAGLPASIEGWGGEAITAPDQRWARRDIKSVSLLPNVLAKQAAREAGAMEAILLDADGRVTEGSSTTVWAVCADGVLRTCALGHHILPGCTRAALVSLLDEAGIGFEERAIDLGELRAAREVFLTSATSFVRPVLRLDGAPVGEGAPGPVTRRLFGLLARHVDPGRNAP